MPVEYPQYPEYPEYPENPEYPEYPQSLPPPVRLSAQGALFVKLLVHKCHVNKLNLYNQVKGVPRVLRVLTRWGSEYPEYSGNSPGGGVPRAGDTHSGYSRASARPGAVT